MQDFFTKFTFEKVRVGFALRDATKGETVWVYSSIFDTIILTNIEGEGELYFDIDIQNLGSNLYGLYIGLSDPEMTDLAYDVWDINGTILEIESNSEMFKNGMSVIKPYIITQTKIIHTRL